MVKLSKKIIIFLVTCVMLLVGCSGGGSYKITIGEVEFNKKSVSGSYKEFSGYKYKNIKLEEGSTISLDLEVKTKEGSLTVKILDDEDNEMLNMSSDIEEQEKSLFIENTGTYKIRVEGDKHKGEFKLGWDVNS